MKKAMLLCLLAFPAWGGQAELTWEIPRTYCDGSPMATPDNYTLTYGQKKETLSPGTLINHTVTGLAPGLWWFSLAANVTNPTAVPPKVDQSQFVTVEKTIPPEEFVTKSNNVYTFFRSNGNISVIKTNHTVPLGVMCDATQSVNGKYKVALESVVWLGTKLTAALADCG